MALNPLSGAGPAGIAGAGMTPTLGQGADSFGKVMQAQPGPKRPAHPEPVEGRPCLDKLGMNGTRSTCSAAVAKRAENAQLTAKVEQAGSAAATRVLDHVTAAQKKMDQVLKLAESGRSFSPAELLSLQAHVYRASQELDLAGKVVEKATGGVKQVLQTQL